MALNIFSGVMTVRQILAQADRLGGNPRHYVGTTGQDYEVDSISGVALQSILDDLAMTGTWSFNRTASTFQISSQITTLPGTFWRIGASRPAYLIDPDSGARTPLDLYDLQTFHDHFGEEGYPTGLPTRGYIKKDNGTLIVEPAPDKVYTAELHYYPWEPALTSSGSPAIFTADAKPWFPNSRYLIFALLGDVYLSQDDTRWQQAEAKAVKHLSDVKKATADKNDKGTAVVELDTRFYRRIREF